jgi:Cu2+-exporting ATPase
VLLHDENLGAYYGLRGERGVPVSDQRPERRDRKWIDLLSERIHAEPAHARVTLDVQGLHCVGCVWLIEEVFSRAPGGERVLVNPSVGRVEIFARPDFDLHAFVRSVERFGYLFGPPVKSEARASSDLLWRLGVCVAIAMNSMIFGIAIYAGLDRGPLFSLFTTLNMVLGAAAVAIGGTVFIRSAWRATVAGMLHLDLPIALGIVLVFAGSVHSYFTRRSQAAYFDTLDVFIALMLLGRWLQERVVDRNRAWLLASDGTEGLLARRIRDGRTELVPCADLRQEDSLLIAAGDLVPVDARVERSPVSFSLDWINGESRTRRYGPGDVVPAGAFLVGAEAVVLRATTDFARSPLRELLRAPAAPADDRARMTPWWQRLARTYVVGVLTVSAAAFLGWWIGTRDAARALSVTTAVLIVTCPCAFGIATPLAYEMVQAGLRKRGLFVRRGSFLDRALSVRHVVFDKTGTLTTGSLVLTNPRALELLPESPRRALYDLAARSSHPKSVAIRDAFGTNGLLDDVARVVERPGVGVELERDGRWWRLGDPRWACASPPPTGGYDVAFSVDYELVAGFHTAENLRADASSEIQGLVRDGYDVSLLSGDAQGRVDAAAVACGLPVGCAHGGRDPQAKAAFLDAHDAAHTLFIGDGVNDALALDHARVSGTPAIDRPFVPARADFFFVTPGLAPIRLALRSSRALAQVVRVDLAIALAYNAVTVGLALAGLMSPVACAVLMPASSLTTIAVTVAALSPRSRVWRS